LSAVGDVESGGKCLLETIVSRDEKNWNGGNFATFRLEMSETTYKFVPLAESRSDAAT